MVVPLDQKVISVTDDKTGKVTQFPALHPRWKRNMSFLCYLPPPLDQEDRGSVEEWMERVTFIESDLHLLLKLPHDKFWCQVIFDEGLHKSIDSFLKFAPRSHDVVFSLGPEVKDKLYAVHRLYFMTCLRMATYKESKESQISPEEFGKILYQNYLFDIPKLMDLCVLYGTDNGPLMTKMVSNIFTQQLEYWSDLRAVVPTVLQVFQSIGRKCRVRVDSAPSSPVKLSDPDALGSPLVAMGISEFQDVIFYLMDTAQTLWAFLDVFPQGAMAFWEGTFPLRLASVYEALVPKLKEALRERDWTGVGVRALLCRTLCRAQACLLMVFRQIVFQCCLQPVLDKTDGQDEDTAAAAMETHVEDYLQLMSAILSERRFLAHLEAMYPFAEDRDLLTQANYPVDETRLQFIQDGVNQALNLHGRKRKPGPMDAPKEPPRAQDSDVTMATSAGADAGVAGALGGDAYTVENYEELGACATRVTGVELESMITAVKDILPELGEGFIELCLEEYSYETEKVINALLEDQLLPSLLDLDRGMARDTAKVEAAMEPVSLLSERANIYDNDEFDVFSHNTVDTQNIHQGKKDKVPSTALSLLDEKPVTDDLRPLYHKYGEQFVESMYESANFEYDDEYDDTYDSNVVGAGDADSADELLSKRPLFLPKQMGALNSPATGTEDEQQESDEEGARPRDSFVEDPAKIRERQAQRRATKEAQNRQRRRPPGGPPVAPQGGPQGGGPPGGPPGGGPQPEGQGARARDVVGQAKGQGQSADVLRNRAWKEKHKSSRVNHNRKALSDKKHKF